jgi:ABC-type lipoprotein export system ATPase subunit
MMNAESSEDFIPREDLPASAEDECDITTSGEHREEAMQPETKAVTIVAENLTRHFRYRGERIKAVDGVSFTFTEGQFITVMGPSGSGKSTLLYILGGLDKATDGNLTIDGVDVRRLSARQEHLFRRNKLGFIFQSFHLIPNLTALENVMLPMELSGKPSGAQRRERARQLLRQVGVNDDRHQHKPDRLSGGQQQRVAIARALANDPKVILADEPTGNLDSRNGKMIIQLLKQLSTQNRTIIVVTHDRSIANASDVRVELEDGQIQSMDNYTPRVIKTGNDSAKKRKKRKNV